MPNETAPGVSAIDRAVADFRAWYEAAATELENLPADEGEKIDLATVVGQFAALRHEVNLQTRASRTQLEHNGQAVEQLTQALAALQRQQTLAQKDQQQAQDELLRPLLRTLIDLHDAMSLARREVQRVQEALGPHLDQLALAAPTAPPHWTPPPAVNLTTSWWGRLFGANSPNEALAAWYEQQQSFMKVQLEALAEQRQVQGKTAVLTNRVRQSVQSILTGYTMSLQRLERTIQQHDLEPLTAVGETFDPETMEVLEAVHDTGRPTGEVLEEIRRGYRWRGRVFRFAQVKVARS